MVNIQYPLVLCFLSVRICEYLKGLCEYKYACEKDTGVIKQMQMLNVFNLSPAGQPQKRL